MLAAVSALTPECCPHEGIFPSQVLLLASTPFVRIIGLNEPIDAILLINQQLAEPIIPELNVTAIPIKFHCRRPLTQLGFDCIDAFRTELDRRSDAGYLEYYRDQRWGYDGRDDRADFMSPLLPHAALEASVPFADGQTDEK